MAYTVENGVWRNVFAVPCEIVDKHLKLSGAASLKALLILLRSGGSAQPEELAEALSLTLADVQDAMNYWVHLGVVRQEEDRPAAFQSAPEPQAQPAPRPQQPEPPFAQPAQVAQPAVPEPAAPELAGEPDEPSPATRPGVTRKRLSTKEINEMSKSDETIAYLLQEAQSVIGKPLTPVITDTVVSLYSYYGIKPEVLLMLLQYCVSIGKDNMRYVEKVAAGWIERGIDTHEKAEEELKRRSERDRNENKIKSLFGIYDRNLTSGEKQYIQGWTEEMGFSIDLIQMAFERAVEAKGKLSFPYINGILQNWQKAGVSTTREAAQEIARNKGKKFPAAAAAAAASNASYDMNEIENLITYGELGR